MSFGANNSHSTIHPMIQVKTWTALVVLDYFVNVLNSDSINFTGETDIEINKNGHTKSIRSISGNKTNNILYQIESYLFNKIFTLQTITENFYIRPSHSQSSHN